MKMALVNQAKAQRSVLICVALLAVSLAGCKGDAAPLSEAEKQNWKGTSPPPGFEKEMAKQSREWQEKHPISNSQPGATPPPGVVVK